MSSDLKLDWATHKAASYAVENWHYSRTMPVGKCVKIGVWERNAFIGALVYSWGANHNMARSIGLAQVECCELVRVALREHASPVTRIMAIAGRMLRKQSPGLRAIVSYADPNKGHHGGIYQGGGWVYLGETAPTFVYELHGKELHKRAFTGQQFGNGKASKRDLPPGAVKVQRQSKHKYVFALNEHDKARMVAMSKPYPKKVRAESADSGTPTVQVGRDGAEPISALHLEQ
jgi:hypothetical protein